MRFFSDPFARVIRQVLGLDHHLDPLEMGRKALALPWRPLLTQGFAIADNATSLWGLHAACYVYT